MVTLGHIDYLNCIPVHGGILLKKVPFKGKIITGPPAYLNNLLSQCKVDISPSSSVEILKGHYIVPNLSISSKSDVQSIMLFTKNKIEEIDTGTILITSHSATSSLLAKVIFIEFFKANLSFEIFNPEKTVNTRFNNAIGILHIGDIALKYFLENTTPQDFYFKYDLASIWHEKTKGLPFTFALWQIPEKSKNKKGISEVIDSLYKSYQFFKENEDLLAEFSERKSGFKKEQIINYWSHLDFKFESRHIESLTLFFDLLKKHNLISSKPEIKFI
ncbi:MAG: menaquinone biosynthesis protein [Proteobacteria bacterium]|nr:menaquinone biosynthesis protein [Pseudomonadota bacterium]